LDYLKNFQTTPTKDTCSLGQDKTQKEKFLLEPSPYEKSNHQLNALRQTLHSSLF
jgi:hypothetical protein